MKKILYNTLTSWESFQKLNNLSNEQLNKFKIYYELLRQANELFNITTITDLQSILNYHFQDSLFLGYYIDLNTVKSIVDVGTGGGFPGIPLKIMYPHLNITLIEVVGKKINFLKSIIESLELNNIDIFTQDWRMFLRKPETTERHETYFDFAKTSPDTSTHLASPLKINEHDIFCARASLVPEELIRMFKPSSPYKNSRLIYWASKEWQANKQESKLIKDKYTYNVGNKTRRLILFES